MKRKILWAAFAALLIAITAIWFVPQFGTSQNTEIQPIEPTVQIVSPTVRQTLESSISPHPSLQEDDTVPSQRMPDPKPLTPNKPKKQHNYAFTLDILNTTVNVANGVDESTLDKTPGWLTTSAKPGETGVCVVYGHRNRNHLRVLQDIQVGDEITVKTEKGSFIYTVQSIDILDSEADIRIPATNEKQLLLATCYPFRYTGHAPKKVVVYAQILIRTQ